MADGKRKSSSGIFRATNRSSIFGMTKINRIPDLPHRFRPCLKRDLQGHAQIA
jgi:hypothetical protein